MKDLISHSDFTKIEIRLGTIISAKLNNKLKNPSYVLKIDFGDEVGVKKSSAQLKENYFYNDLINKQILAVVNFQPKQIGNLISEVLVLGFPDNLNQPVLVEPNKRVPNGGKLF